MRRQPPHYTDASELSEREFVGRCKSASLGTFKSDVAQLVHGSGGCAACSPGPSDRV
jgi:hypothetical protein